MVDHVRLAAFAALRAVDERDAYANLVLPSILSDHRITGRDAAFATELVHGTLRMRGAYDAVIGQVASRGLESLDAPVLDALRMGAHQVLSMRVSAHAAVSETVDVVRREIGRKPVGLVNALLRRISTRPLADWLTDATRDSDETDALAIRTSHPRWIVEALRDVVGAAALPALLEAQNRPPRVTLVARPGLCEPSDLPGEPGRLSPFARILTAGGVPGEIPHVRDGRAGVQDEGSQMVAITAADAVLDGRDERWLDLCAGPGGKAALLGAIAAQRGVTLVANELQEHRADLVRQAVRALPDVEVVSYDGCEGPWADESFDRVLVDAPCTGLGALRRRPEARWRRSPEDLELLVPLQKSLLLRALQVVRVGGVVTYATCSPHLAETDRVVEAVVGETGAELVSVHRWWPHVDGTDAMFAAALRRR